MKSSLLGDRNKGMIFVLSAPAGTGKTTLVSMLTREFANVVSSISFTSRPPRPSEIDGVDYHFIDEDSFKRKIEEGEFLEYIQLYGFYYGTSRKWLSEKLEEGKHVILVIDTQGACQLRNKIKASFIFMLPPSIEELRQRLQKRRTESQEMLEKRLQWALKEIEASSDYDYQIVNDDLAMTYEILRSILIAEAHRVSSEEIKRKGAKAQRKK